jgi:Leucine-rich repeat (LRR) protein
LRGFPKLQHLAYSFDSSTGTPSTTAAQFWQDYEKTGWLRALHASGVSPNKAQRLPDGTWDLDLKESSISSLEVLRGAPISKLHVGSTAVADLSPLRGMPLKELHAHDTKIADLRPLAGMPLEYLHLGSTPVKDISPLRGLPLHTLWLDGCTGLSDISPLAEAKRLTTLFLPSTAQNIGFLRSFPHLEFLSFTWDSRNRKPATTAKQFWEEYNGQGWLQKLSESSITPKVLKRLNDGTWEVDLNKTPLSELEPLRGAPISSLNLGDTRVSDLTPLRGMRLKKLWIYNTRVADLRPLEGMPLEFVNMYGSKAKDISVFRGMPIRNLKLHDCSELTDLSPLRDVKTLVWLTLPPSAEDYEFLRNFPNLERIGFKEEGSKGPNQTAEQFWKEYDEQTWLRDLRRAGIAPRKVTRLADGTWEVNLMELPIKDLSALKGARISMLQLGRTNISDLRPLRGMPLRNLLIYSTKVADLSPLQGMRLEQLHLSRTDVTDISALRGMPLTSLRLHHLQPTHRPLPPRRMQGTR